MFCPGRSPKWAFGILGICNGHKIDNIAKGFRTLIGSTALETTDYTFQAHISIASKYLLDLAVELSTPSSEAGV